MAAGSAAGVTRSRDQYPNVHHQLLAEWRRMDGSPGRSRASVLHCNRA